MWRVKVCGLTRWSDAIAASNADADALGFVLEPKSPRFIGEEPWYWVRAIGGCLNVGVMGESIEVSDDVLRLFQVIQAFGNDAKYHKARIPVFRPHLAMTLDDWLVETRSWDWCLLDPYHDGLAGGTGTSVDWDKASDFVARFDGRVILAGGLGPDNVHEAILKVKPFGVDASSRLESSPGLKDAELVRSYVSEAWDALCEVHKKSMQELWDEAAAIRLTV
ncbi:MAG: phosphoribosylanthranilate isomerase [Fimbriimonadaceae bacterium]